jgi:hypothetical protein
MGRISRTKIGEISIRLHEEILGMSTGLSDEKGEISAAINKSKWGTSKDKQEIWFISKYPCPLYVEQG